MCTATWLRQQDSFTLCFNRDESVNRVLATPPQIEQINNVNVIMPIDPEGMGSWIAVNEYGLAVCLLNNYEASFNNDNRQWLSRGQIIRELSTSTCISDVDKRMKAMPLGNVRGFQILAMCGTNNEPFISSWIWDGVECIHVRDDQQIFSSSAFNTQPVVSNRQQFFERHIAKHEVTIDSLRQFHSTQHTEDGSLGVCMIRPEAQTVSYTEIHVSGNLVRMNYTPGRPSQQQLQDPAHYQQQLKRQRLPT